MKLFQELFQLLDRNWKVTQLSQIDVLLMDHNYPPYLKCASLEPTSQCSRMNSTSRNKGPRLVPAISPIVANDYMEHFESKALDTAPIPPAMWYRYVDDTMTKIHEGSLRSSRFRFLLAGQAGQAREGIGQKEQKQ